MAIVWTEMESSVMAPMFKWLRGVGESGEIYHIWHRVVVIPNNEQLPLSEIYNPERDKFYSNDNVVDRWMVYGWPESDEPCYRPVFESYREAMALCEEWEAIMLDAQKRARSASTPAVRAVTA